MHAYVDYVTEFIPENLNDCTHPWSPLASRTIDPITLLEGITGKFDGNLVLDTNAVLTITSSKDPWKELFRRVLIEDPRLSAKLGMEYNGGALLRYARNQIAQCFYNNNKYNNELFANRWFLKVVRGNGIIGGDKYTKLGLRDSDVIPTSTITVIYWVLIMIYAMSIACSEAEGLRSKTCGRTFEKPVKS